MSRPRWPHAAASILLALSFVACGGSQPGGPSVADAGINPAPRPGATDFTSRAPVRFAAALGGKDRNTGGTAAPPEAAPSGRTDLVEEGDIYRVEGDRFYYFNTYRGFLTYDLTDPKKPARLGRVPVFGYPVEMFVQGTTVLALLRQALTLTSAGGEMRFERREVSQLLSIDVSDPRNPRLQKAIDIAGDLREGVSRRVGDTLYVVSYSTRSSGYAAASPVAQKESATVHSFDLTNPADPRLVESLGVFQGGSVQNYDPSTGNTVTRTFRDVTIGATSNVLMVVENWDVWSYVNGGQRCGLSSSSQEAVVSLVDISDPAGAIRVHAHFATTGSLGDQFKMNYVVEPDGRIGTFYGIFRRQIWSSADCTGSFVTQNTLESWDVTRTGGEKRLGALDFGKRNETVRGSAFDLTRNVVFAITAERVDPMYAISIADRTAPKVLSAIDGLAGDMTVFRLIGDGKFLLAVGQDNSEACAGFQDVPGWRPSKVAVSVIDVRDLGRIRLAQRQCVAVKDAEWISSAVLSNLDQAHKMIGQHSDGTSNVVTVPIYYYSRGGEGDWWWYRYQTAVGILSWDLSRYDDALPPAAQTVLANRATFNHPDGEVRRSIVFAHSSGRRLMANLSDTHLSVADIGNLDQPALQATVELAPYYNRLYRFGPYMVEQVQQHAAAGSPSTDVAEFRVKLGMGDLEEATPVATFSVGQVQRVVQHGNLLVLFRQTTANVGKAPEPVSPSTEALIYDLSDPTRPRATGTIQLPAAVMPWYRYWCGVEGFWGGFWFDASAPWTSMDAGLVFLVQEYKYDAVNLQGTVSSRLLLLDLRSAAAPTLVTADLPEATSWNQYSLVADPVRRDGFYLNGRTSVGVTGSGDDAVESHRDFTQRWALQGATLAGGGLINLPGVLIETLADVAGGRLYLTQDADYREVMNGQSRAWYADTRLALLREISTGGRAVAELLDTRTFADATPGSLLVDGRRIFLTIRPRTYGVSMGGGVATGGTTVPGTSTSSPMGGLAGATAQVDGTATADRFVALDLRNDTLALAYDQPTMTYGLTLMGSHNGRLYAAVPGDGILIVDATDVAHPLPAAFVRTLGWASHVAFGDSDVYIAAGHFGIYREKL